MAKNLTTAGATMTGVGSTTLPAQALVGSASARLELLEICVVNTTAVACVWHLLRLTGAGTPGSSLTSAQHDTADVAPTGVVKQVYTGTAPTAGADLGYRLRIPGVVGAGIIRTFEGLIIPATAAAAIAIIIDAGSGQLCDVDWTWIEL